MPRDEYGDWMREGLIHCSGTLTETGSIQLPREFVEFLSWQEGDRLTAELSGDDRGLVLYRSRDICAHCGGTNELMRVQRGGEDTGTCICHYCYSELKIEEMRKSVK